jgi:hypothetical protein
MAAKKKPAPYKGAAATPKPPAKKKGTAVNPLEDKDIAYNKAVDTYTKHRNAAIAAEKKYGAQSKAYKAAQSRAVQHAKNLAVHHAEATERQRPGGVSYRKGSAAEAREQQRRSAGFMKTQAAKVAADYRRAHVAPKPPTHFTEKIPPQPPVHLYDRLATGAQKNAYLAIKTEFDKFGLSSLAPRIFDYIKQGFSSDTISLLLQQSPEYKQRFAGNEERVKRGMQALSPAEYLATESSYRQLMRQSGLPSGFYDKPSDFANFIGKDVSPQELKDRADMAFKATQASSQGVKDALKQYYGIDEAHIAAYFLDPGPGLEAMKNRMAEVQIGGAAKEQGLSLTSESIAQEAAKRGVTYQQAQEAYSNISGFLGHAMELANIYGQQYSQQTAEQEALLGSGKAQQQREQLFAQERATFSGKSGLGEGGLRAS